MKYTLAMFVSTGNGRYNEVVLLHSGSQTVWSVVIVWRRVTMLLLREGNLHPVLQMMFTSQTGLTCLTNLLFQLTSVLVYWMAVRLFILNVFSAV